MIVITFCLVFLLILFTNVPSEITMKKKKILLAEVLSTIIQDHVTITTYNTSADKNINDNILVCSTGQSGRGNKHWVCRVRFKLQKTLILVAQRLKQWMYLERILRTQEMQVRISSGVCLFFR